NPSSFNLTVLIQEVIADLNQTYKHHIVLQGAINHDITTDKGKIDQVITNLIHNAAKYSSSTTEIIVTLQELNDSVVVSVQDFGIGIDAHNLEDVFKPFYRIKGHRERTFPGLGMGLFISNEIIKYLGGRMWLESAKGKGSTFYFSLPLI
ncbi:MAG TPA: ATP-binding protein, partial [Candidatus Woesebacteria bacterium]|nr:ATP-binding protein [Candidatus Woesebacteria bacterium]